MKIIKYRKAQEEGCLIADFSVEFQTEYGTFQVNKLRLFSKNGNRWISFPSEKFEKDGEIKFFDYCYFNGGGSERFRKDCIEAIERFRAEAGLNDLQSNNAIPSISTHQQTKIDQPNQNVCVSDKIVNGSLPF